MVGLDYDEFTYDYLDSKDMIVVGDPEREHSMDSIRLFGEEVIPAFS